MLTNHSCHNTPSVVSRHCAQNRTLELRAYPTPMLGLRYAYATEVGKMCASALFFNTSGYALGPQSAGGYATRLTFGFSCSRSA